MAGKRDSEFQDRIHPWLIAGEQRQVQHAAVVVTTRQRRIPRKLIIR